MTKRIRLTIWNEFSQERRYDRFMKEHPNGVAGTDLPPSALRTFKQMKDTYPGGIHQALADGLQAPDIEIRCATQDQPEHGLPEEVLENTDVLIWWSHALHHEVDDRVVARIQTHVLHGMGFIALHSSHVSKPFCRIMGTSGALLWRDEEGVIEKERIWTIEPSHPIAEGIGPYVELAHEEMYGERFDIPTPDKLVFISWFAGGEVFRSGCCWERGHGRVFYFQPGHESNPIYYHPQILRIIGNAVRWAAPRIRQPIDCRFSKSPERD